jgi:hypothetical protein
MFLLRAAFVTSSFWGGALPPVDLLAVCFVLAILPSAKTLQSVLLVSPKFYADCESQKKKCGQTNIVILFG